MGDEPRADLPTEAELKTLSRWARVAFAVRCAQRVQPLFSYFWPDAPPEYHAAVDRAIMLASRSAARPTAASYKDLSAVADVADLAAPALKRLPAAYAAAKAASHAASACHYFIVSDVPGWGAKFQLSAAEVDGTGDDHVVAVAEAAVAGARAAVAQGFAGDAGAYAAERRDFNLLAALQSAAEGAGTPWGDETGVDPDLLGPLWPFGEPEGWPIQPADDEPEPVMKLEVALPTGMSEAEQKTFDAKVVELLTEMSRMHAAMGGTGLRVLDERSCEPIPEESPVEEHASGGVA
jgi:hypothetical protein